MFYFNIYTLQNNCIIYLFRYNKSKLEINYYKYHIYILFVYKLHIFLRYITIDMG